MGAERRKHARYPDIKQAELVVTLEDGGEHRYPVMLRDSSETGRGAVYVGQERLDPEADYLLEEAGAGVRRIRMAWIRPVADYVAILGLQVLDS